MKGRRTFLFLASLAAVASGFAALAYQVAWLRLAELFLGITQQAVAVAVGSFMLGLALGAMSYRRLVQRVDQPLLVLAGAEALVGLFGLAVPWLLGLAPGVYRLLGPDCSAWKLTFWRGATTLAILTPPTAAMGLTYPALVDAFRKRFGPGISAATPYAANTAGAVLGALGTGLVLFPAGGLDLALTAALGANVLAAGLAMTLRPQPIRSPGLPQDDRWQPFRFTAAHVDLVQALLAAFFGSMAALASEVIWQRIFGLVLDGTVYGFSVLLATVLAGMAVGSAVAGRRLEAPRPVGSLTLWHAGAALATSAAIAAVPWIAKAAALAAPTFGDPRRAFAFKALLSALVLLPAAVCWGGAFPTAVRLAQNALPAGQAAAWVSASSTFGGLVGALGAGYLLPTLGVSLDASAGAAAMLSAAGAGMVLVAETARTAAGLPRTRHLRLLAAAPAIPAVFLLAIRPSFRTDRLVSLRYAMEDYEGRLGLGRGDGNRLVALWEGRQLLVSLHRDAEGGLRLRNNGLNEAYHTASEPHYAKVVFALAALGYGLHPDSRTALIVGLGSGGTLEASLATNLERITVVELEPAVVAASRALYEALGLRRHPLDDPRVRLVTDDARNFLLRNRVAGRPGYDLVISQPSHPWLAGMGALYSREFFRLVADGLAPGGLFCQWVNLFRMDGPSFRSLLAALGDVFPAVHAFKWDADSLVLVAGRTQRLDPRILARHLGEDRFARAAAAHGLDLYDFLLAYRFGPTRARKLAAGARALTDRRPLLEMRLAWLFHDEKLAVSDLLRETGLPWGLLPRNVVPAADTPLLWSGLARRAVDAVAEGTIERHPAEALLRSLEPRLGAEAAYLLGRLALEDDDEETALREFRRAYRAGLWDAGRELGEILVQRGQCHRARQVFERLLAHWPRPGVRGALAELLLPGDPDRAIRLAESVLRETESDEEPHCRALLTAARIFADRGDLPAAVDLVGRHLDCQPDSAQGHHLAARLAAAAGDTTSYLDHVRRAVASESALADRYENKIRALTRRGLLEQATRTFCRLRELGQQRPAAVRLLAAAWADRGRYDLAALLGWNPKHPNLAQDLAGALADYLMDEKNSPDVCRVLLRLPLVSLSQGTP